MTEAAKTEKPLIRKDLRKESLMVKGGEPDYFKNFSVKVYETNCEYTTRTVKGEYIAEIVNCDMHSQGVSIIVELEDFGPFSKEMVKALYLIRINQKRKTWLGRILNRLISKNLYLVNPYIFMGEDMTTDHPGKEDGRYERYLRHLQSERIS